MNSGNPDPQGGSQDDSREKWITIDRLCDAYEASLQEGDVERAPFLAGVPRDWRDQLGQELDAIDAAYRDAEETREQTLRVPPSEAESRRLPTTGRLAELATLDRDKIWLGRFEIRKRLGTGATGSVWCARDARLARWVALKVPHATRVMSETSAARFQTEARAAAAISHPNVVQVHEVLIEDGLPILIQQWIDGPSLAKYMKDHGPLDFDQAAQWMSQIADAVACAHEKGIVHRDLKPANVMLNQDRPMVLDFGLASYPQFSSGLTSEGTVLGTPAYMSPEQAEGSEIANQPATDIYALGTILYEMLVGTPPFVGKAREVLQANKTTIPTPPRSRRAGIPRDLETIALRCLAKSPSARYRSAAELRDDLQRFRRREPIRARKVSTLENIWAWCRLHPAYALLAAGIPLVMILTMGILIAELRHSRLFERTNRLVRQNREGESERQRLLAQRNMVELSRAAQELSEGDRSRGLELLRSIPESARNWEWKLLDLIAHSPSQNLNAEVVGDEAGAAVNCLAVSTKHRKLFAGSEHGTVAYWKLPPDRDFFNTESDKQVGPGERVVLSQTQSPITAMAISANHNWLAWVDIAGEITVWDLNENERAQQISTGSKRGLAIAFSPDSKVLVVGGGSLATRDRPADVNSWLRAYRLGDSGEFSLIAKPRWSNRAAITSMVFFGDGRLATSRGQLDLSSTAMGFVEAWDCSTDSLRYSGLAWRGLGMYGLDYDPVTNRLSWCDDGGIAYLKDLSQPIDALPRQFRAGRHEMRQTRFSPDGQELVVIGADGDVSRWSTPAPRLATETAEAAATSNDHASADADKTSGDSAATPPPAATAKASTAQKKVAKAAVQPQPIRHLRDYRGHENTVRDSVYLAPCQNPVMRGKTRDPKLQFCMPFLVTAAEDGRVLRWANEEHEEITTTNLGDRPLIDATWLSNRQIAASVVGTRRQAAPFYQQRTLPDHRLDLDLRRIRGARVLTSTSPHQSHAAPPTGDAPERYAVCTKNTVQVFQVGNSAMTKKVVLPADFKGAVTAATIIRSHCVVAGHSRIEKQTPTPQKQKPDADAFTIDLRLFLYDLNTDTAPKELVLPFRKAVSRLRLSPDGKQIVGSTLGGKMFAAQLDSTPDAAPDWAKAPLKSWTAHRRAIRDFAWIGDQGTLATVADDGICAIWSPATYPLDADIAEPGSEAIFDDNQSAVSETPDLIKQDSPGTPELSQRLLVSSSPVTRVTACSSGKRIATVGADRVVRIWDTDSGLELLSLQPRKASIAAVEFSPDNQHLMIAESNSRIEVIRLLESR